MAESLTIKRPVVVKVKVTDSFRNQMASDIQETIRKMDAELAQLDFQLKRMVAELEKRNPHGIASARQHVENEQHKRIKAKEKLTEQLKEIGRVALGSEIIQGTLETVTEVRVGDDWADIMGVEIVICDNKIIEIRRRKTDSYE